MRRVLPALACLAAVALPHAPADAAVVGSARVSFHPIPGGWWVCADGSVGQIPVDPNPDDDVAVPSGSWFFDFTGDRDGVPYTPGPLQESASSLRVCVEVMKEGATTGTIVATLVYAGAGDLLAYSSHGMTWSPQTGDRTFGVDPHP